MPMPINRLTPRKAEGRRTRASRDNRGTARRSVYRLTIAPTVEAMTAAFLPDSETTIETTERAGCPMVVATGRRVRHQVHWKPDYTKLTGIDTLLDSSNPFAIVL